MTMEKKIKIVITILIIGVIVFAIILIFNKPKALTDSEQAYEACKEFNEAWSKKRAAALPPCSINTLVCITECKNLLFNGEDLSKGPCLMNGVEINKNTPHNFTDENWVCDIVHSPRQNIDDQIENQCSLYLEGKAKNLIELDENCRVMRVVFNIM